MPLRSKEQKRAYDAAYHATAAYREREARRWVWFAGNLRILKAAQGCTDCRTHEGSLDYHHLDPSTKRRGVMDMFTYSLKSLFDEIAKCTVLCKSCHKLRYFATEEE